MRVDFQFDRAAFDLASLPFKIPYPVPFKLLGDETKVRLSGLSATALKQLTALKSYTDEPNIPVPCQIRQNHCTVRLLVCGVVVVCVARFAYEVLMCLSMHGFT